MTTHLLYLSYCLVMLIFYIALSIHEFRHHNWTYNVVINIGIAICFVLYLGNYKMFALAVGLGSVAVQMIITFYINSHPQIYRRRQAKRHADNIQRIQRKNNKHNKQEVSNREDIL